MLLMMMVVLHQCTYLELQCVIIIADYSMAVYGDDSSNGVIKNISEAN